MSVIKEDVSISDALGAYLSYTPSYAETDQFRTDLACLNHTLLRDAIAECVKAEKVHQNADPRTRRQNIHAVYVRKIKELSSLYPFLFSVENALRARAKESYHTVFKNPYWWKAIISAHQRELSSADFELALLDGRELRILNGTPVNPAFIKEALFAIASLTNRQRADLQSEDCPASAFYEKITLKGLVNIISSDYRLCPLPSMSRNDFARAMTVIHDARNEIYHSNPIKNRSQVFSACERILDAVDVHAGSLDFHIKRASYARPTPGISRKPRHCIPPEHDYD